MEPVRAGSEGQRAFDDLTAYYDRAIEPPFREALAQLADSDAAVRSRAGAYLVALLAQALEDQSTDRASVTPTPFWGASGTSDARELRARIASGLVETDVGEEARALVRWLLEHEPDTDIQNLGLNAAGRNATLRTPDLIEFLVSQPHPNPTVLVAAIGEAGRLKLTGLGPQVVRLTLHHRANVRDAARMTAPSLGVEPAPMPATQGPLLGALEAEIQRIGRMVMTPVPRDARWVRVTYEERPHGRQLERHVETSGWLIAESDSIFRVLDLFGRELTIERGNAAIAASALSEEVAGLLAIRQGDNRDAIEQLSRRGGLTGQFEPGMLTLPEALVATWLYLGGDKDAAASILIPRLEEMKNDRWFGTITRDLLGHYYHHAMLEAFSFDRDYPSTTAIARHLSRPEFEGYCYQRRAIELARQLERRGDDFKSFSLTTPSEWEDHKRGLTREQQIAYLAERLRLLNCIQQMQPGSVDFGATQYSAPYFIDDQWEELTNSSEVVINSYTTLREMNLEVADIPALVPFLTHHDFMPTYSFWRDFHPDRDLHRVGEVVEWLINGIAKQSLASEMKVFMLDRETEKAYLDSLVAWSHTHAERSEEDLALELLETTQDEQQFMQAARGSTRFPQALSVILRRMDEFPRQRVRLIETCFQFDSPEAVPKAREWVKEDLYIYRGNAAAAGLDSFRSRSIRFHSAMILLRHGDRTQKEGYAELKALLEEDDEGYWTRQAYEDFLATGEPDAFPLLCAVVKRSRFGLPTYDNDLLLLKLFHGGCEDCFDYLLATLGSEKKAGTSYRTVDGTQVVSEILEGDKVASLLAGWRTDVFAFKEDWPPEQKAAARGELREWLTEQIEKVRAGKKPDMKEPRK